MPQTDDDEILRRLKAGDRSGLTLAYDKYKRPLYSFCLRLLGDQPSAEDAVHGTFLAIAQKVDGLNESSAFRHWVFRIARNEALMQMRSRRTSSEWTDESVWETETPLTLMVGKELTEMIETGLLCLQPEYREVLLLREYEGFTYAEIAEITDSSLSAVKSRIFKARIALGKYLEPRLTERAER